MDVMFYIVRRRITNSDDNGDFHVKFRYKVFTFKGLAEHYVQTESLAIADYHGFEILEVTLEQALEYLLNQTKIEGL